MKKNKELEKIRNDIDKVDEEIVKLLNKRTHLAQKTTKLKGDVVFDPKREKQVLNKISEKSKGPITKERTYTMTYCHRVVRPKNK